MHIIARIKMTMTDFSRRSVFVYDVMHCVENKDMKERERETVFYISQFSSSASHANTHPLVVVLLGPASCNLLPSHPEEKVLAVVFLTLMLCTARLQTSCVMALNLVGSVGGW